MIMLILTSLKLINDILITQLWMSAEHKDFYNYYTLFSAKMGRGSVLIRYVFWLMVGYNKMYVDRKIKEGQNPMERVGSIIVALLW